MEDTVSLAQHLWSAASTITKTDHISNLVRNNLLAKCVARCQFNFKLPAKSFGPNIRCSNCCSEWKDNYSVKIAKRRKLSNKSKHKLKMVAENRNGSRTNKEIQDAKNKIKGNKTLLIKCLHCMKTTKSTLLKDTIKIKKEDLNVTPKSTHGKKFYIGSAKKAKSSITSITKKNNSKAFQTGPSKFITNLNLQNQCYQSTNLTPQVRTSNVSQTGTPNSLGTKGKNNLEGTPVVTKKRQRDKFAGLSKIACVAASPPPPPTPKSNNPLHLLMKVRD